MTSSLVFDSLLGFPFGSFLRQPALAQLIFLPFSSLSRLISSSFSDAPQQRRPFIVIFLFLFQLHAGFT